MLSAPSACSAILRCQIAEPLQAWEEEVGAAAHRRKREQTRELSSNRPFRNLEFQRPVLVADDRVVLVPELVKVLVVGPHVLRELELTDEARANNERGDAALGSIVRDPFPQGWAIGGAPPNHA